MKAQMTHEVRHASGFSNRSNKKRIGEGCTTAGTRDILPVRRFRRTDQLQPSGSFCQEAIESGEPKFWAKTIS